MRLLDAATALTSFFQNKIEIEIEGMYTVFAEENEDKRNKFIVCISI